MAGAVGLRKPPPFIIKVMQTRTEGIVLKSMEYGEADIIVTYLTLDMGIKKGFAKSARKIKSRFGGSLEPMTHSRISLMGKEDATLPRLTQSDIIRPFQELREEYSCFLRICSMVELTCGLLPEGVENRPAFDFLLNMLARMAEGCSALDSLVYRVRLLSMKGYAPRLGGCCGCGTCGNSKSEAGAQGQWFYPTQGSVVCEACAMRPALVLPQDRKLRLPLTHGAARLYETLIGWELDKTARLKASGAMLVELSAIIDAHIEYLLSKPLRVREEPASC